ECCPRRADQARPRAQRHHRRSSALAEADGAARQGARLENSRRTHRFAAFRRVAGAERERARPGPRAGRDCTIVCRGAGSFPAKETSMSNDHKPDHDDDHANDNGDHEKPGSKQVASAPARGALTSLAALQTALANVNTAAYLGRTGLPMLLFKSREGNGTWVYGQGKIIPEPDSRWGANPTTFMWGYISFGNNKKVAGEHLTPVSQPMPDVTKLPDTGFPWQQEWAVNLKCISGADTGVEVILKATTDGAITAVNGLLDTVRNQIESELRNGKTVHDGEIAPIVLLEKD